MGNVVDNKEQNELRQVYLVICRILCHEMTQFIAQSDAVCNTK